MCVHVCASDESIPFRKILLLLPFSSSLFDTLHLHYFRIQCISNAFFGTFHMHIQSDNMNPAFMCQAMDFSILIRCHMEMQMEILSNRNNNGRRWSSDSVQMANNMDKR